MLHFFFAIFNFVLLTFLLVKFLRRPIHHFFQKRAEGIAEEIRNTQDTLQQARRALDQSQRRRQKLSSEIEALQKRVADAGHHERQEIEAVTLQTVKRMEEDAVRHREYYRRSVEQELLQVAMAHAFADVEAMLTKGLSMEEQRRIVDAVMSEFGGMIPSQKINTGFLSGQETA